MCIVPFALTGNTVVTQPTASDAAKPADGLAATVSDAHALNRITPPIDIFPVTTPADHL